MMNNLGSHQRHTIVYIQSLRYPPTRAIHARALQLRATRFRPAFLSWSHHFCLERRKVSSNHGIRARGATTSFFAYWFAFSERARAASPSNPTPKKARPNHPLVGIRQVERLYDLNIPVLGQLPSLSFR